MWLQAGELASGLASEGKIYVVVVGILLILGGMGFYMYRIYRMLSRIESRFEKGVEEEDKEGDKEGDIAK